MTSAVDNVSRIFQAKNNGIDLNVPTVFSSIFLQQAPLIELTAEMVSIELMKGNRKVAPIVSRNGISSQDNDIIIPGQSGVNDYLYGLVEQEFELQANTLNKRVPGESPFQPASKDSRMMFWMQELLQGTVKRVLRRLELLAYGSFFNGEMPIDDVHQGETKLIFPVDAELKGRTVAVSWATAASATPWKDLGDTLRAIIEKGQVKANQENVFSFMSYTAVENLKAIYRNQRDGRTEIALYHEHDFSKSIVPPTLQFLVDNGATYVGWVRSEWGQTPIHIFSTASMYDNGSDTVDYLSGDTVSLCVYSPSFFKTFFGGSTFLTQDESFYVKTLGNNVAGNLNLPDVTEMGNSGYPAEVFMPNIYDLGKNKGIGGGIQSAPIFARMQVNAVATIATTTTA